MKVLIALVALLSVSCVPKPKSYNTPLFLVGTWKVENKEDYEAWTATDATSLQGQGYKVRGGQKMFTEYLSIKTVDGKTIYTATVPGQNNGQPVDFVLNTEVTDKYSFENLTHDFPQKIQYTPQGDAAVFVEVLGSSGRGFSYTMTKQP